VLEVFSERLLNFLLGLYVSRNRLSERLAATSSWVDFIHPDFIGVSILSKFSMYGLRSSNGVPSSTSIPLTVTMFPSTLTISTMESPILLGRTGLRVLKIPRVEFVLSLNGTTSRRGLVT